MKNNSEHTFYIPVMGLGFTIDTPIKVAHFGISSAVSIIHDHMLEQMREFYCKKVKRDFTPISTDDIDHRAKRITAYLNLMKTIVDKQLAELKKGVFSIGDDIVKYFELLPEESKSKQLFYEMQESYGIKKSQLQDRLRKSIKAGSIDVNIMTKVDNTNYTKGNTPLPEEYADAMSALRGYANSDLSSSVIFSAGLNPRLFAYLEKFEDFFPDQRGRIKKKVILKVSDYRSALIQGKFLAKKGIWISEFRIESGLNCGGHAFPTDGRLLGPILEEFKENKERLVAELLSICNQSLSEKERNVFKTKPELRITVQGGIGTAEEDEFLRKHYSVDGTGWGSPFLLVPEATTVDDATLHDLANAKKEDYFLSHASPLGVPFNNFRKSSSETQRLERIKNNKPGSPCFKKYLTFNTEFTKKPICTASRKYQNLKIKELKSAALPEIELQIEIDKVTAKDCLCQGLSAAPLLKNNIPDLHGNKAVTICPGPNLAYFSAVFSLDQLIGHIYGRKNVLNNLNRKHMFLNELELYVDYLKGEIQSNLTSISNKQQKYFTTFQSNLILGIDYYKTKVPQFLNDTEELKNKVTEELEAIKETLYATCSIQEEVLIAD